MQIPTLSVTIFRDDAFGRQFVLDEIMGGGEPYDGISALLKRDTREHTHSLHQDTAIGSLSSGQEESP